MKRLLLIVALFAVFSQSAFVQTSIEGRVTDEMNYPLSNVLVSQNNDNVSLTDENGEFRLTLSQDDAQSIIITHHLYKDVIVNRLDTLSSPLVIRMKLKNNFYQDTLYLPNDSVQQRDYILIERIGLYVDNLKFEDFESLFSEECINKLNLSGRGYSFDLEYINERKLSYGAHFVINYGSEIKLDSLEISTHYQQYGLDLGYKLFDSKRILLIPELRLNWSRYRLLSYSSSTPVTMTQYLEKRELDLRFNQVNFATGLHLAFKIHGQENGRALVIGGYLGYATPLFDTWIYSAGNRVTSSNKLLSRGVVFGMSLTLLYD
jgi:hypothetical protein